MSEQSKPGQTTVEQPKDACLVCGWPVGVAHACPRCGTPVCRSCSGL